MRRHALGLAVALASPLVAQTQVTLRDTVIASGVRAVFGHPNGTVLVIETAEGAVLVDAQSGAEAAALYARIGMPVRLVISTHYHEDHTGGNARFRADRTPVLAHVSVPVEAAKDTTISELGWHREPVPATAMPTILVSGDTTLIIGMDTIVVLHLPGAHTSGDLAVWLPRRNVMHTGDVFEQDAFPFVDWWGGGSLRGMESAVARLLAVTNAGTMIVPGHGHISSQGELAAYGAMLEAVGAGVREALATERTVEETMDATLTAAYDQERGARAGRRFVGILYLGLSR